MLFDDIRNIKSTKKELRQFGFTLGIVLGLLWALFVWKHRAVSAYLWMTSIVFVLAAWAVPMLLKPIQKVWMAGALFLGAVMTRVILTLLFYLVVAPLGLLTRILGKDFLNRKFREPKDSYWISREGREFNRADYEKQF